MSKQVKIEPECTILLLYTKPSNQSKKTFLSPKKVQKIDFFKKFPTETSCDASQNFPWGHKEYLAWSEFL